MTIIPENMKRNFLSYRKRTYSSALETNIPKSNTAL
jgi:hypothetical protein